MTQTNIPAEKVFNAISQYVAHSKAQLEAGQVVDLSDLDTYVQTLCEVILELSQEERLRYADRLQKLLGDVSALGETLMQKRDELGVEIN